MFRVRSASWFALAAAAATVLTTAPVTAQQAGGLQTGCVLASAGSADGLQDHERWAVAQASKGEPVDFDGCYGSQLNLEDDAAAWRDPTKPRVLSAKAFSLILERAQHRELLVYGALIEEELNLTGIEPKVSIAIVGSRLEKTANLSRAKLKALTLMASRFEGFVDLGKSDIDGDLRLDCRKGGFCNDFKGEVSLVAAKVKGSLDVIGATFAMGLAAPDATIGGALNIRTAILNAPSGKRSIDAPGVSVGGGMALAGLSASGPVKLDLMSVNGNLLIEEDSPNLPNGGSGPSRPAGFAANVSLRAASITRGGLYIQNARIEGSLDLTGVTIRDSLAIKQAASIGAVQMLEADIGDSFLVGADLAPGPGRAQKWNEDCKDPGKAPWTEITGALDALGAKVGGSVDIDRAKVGAVDFNGLNTRLSLLISQCADIKRIKLRTTQVGDLLSIRRDKVETKENKRILELEGLTYAKFDYNNSRWPDLTDNDAEFSVQPYRQLARVFAEFGRKSDEEDALYAARNKELELSRCACACGSATASNVASQCQKLEERADWYWNCPRFLGLLLLKWTIGFGIGSGYFFVLVPMALLVAVGVVVLKTSPVLYFDSYRNAIWTSIDEMLPIVELSKEHGEHISHLTEWRRSYFFIQRILAWLFGLFVLAGVTGLTQGG